MNENVTESPLNQEGAKLLTSIACIALILDTTVNCINNMSGKGIELIDTNGREFPLEKLRDIVGRQVHVATNAAIPATEGVK